MASAGFCCASGRKGVERMAHRLDHFAPEASYAAAQTSELPLTRAFTAARGSSRRPLTCGLSGTEREHTPKTLAVQDGRASCPRCGAALRESMDMWGPLQICDGCGHAFEDEAA